MKHLWSIKQDGASSNDLELLQRSRCSRASWLAEDDPDCCDSCAKASEPAEACTSLQMLALARHFRLLWFFYSNVVAFAPARGKVFSGSKTMQCWKRFLPQKRNRPYAPCPASSDTPLLASTASATRPPLQRLPSQQLQVAHCAPLLENRPLQQLRTFASCFSTAVSWLCCCAAAGQTVPMRQSFLMLQWRKRQKMGLIVKRLPFV